MENINDLITFDKKQFDNKQAAPEINEDKVDEFYISIRGIYGDLMWNRSFKTTDEVANSKIMFSSRISSLTDDQIRYILDKLINQMLIKTNRDAKWLNMTYILGLVVPDDEEFLGVSFDEAWYQFCAWDRVEPKDISKLSPLLYYIYKSLDIYSYRTKSIEHSMVDFKNAYEKAVTHIKLGKSFDIPPTASISSKVSKPVVTKEKRKQCSEMIKALKESLK